MKKGTIVLEALAIAGIALVLGTGSHLLRWDKERKIDFVSKLHKDCFAVKAQEQPKPPQPVVPPPPPPPDPKKGPVREIGLDEAKAEHDNGTPFLDARRTEQFQQSRVAGARSVSVWEAGLDERIAALANEIPTDIPVIVYCIGGNCEDSHTLAQQLQLFGYKDIRIMTDGFREWEKRNFPSEKPDDASGAPGDSREEGKR